MSQEKSDDELLTQVDHRGFWVREKRFCWTLREALELPGTKHLEGPGGVRIDLNQIARLGDRLAGGRS